MSNKSEFNHRLVDVFVAGRKLRIANINGQSVGAAYLAFTVAMDEAEKALGKIGEAEDGYVGANHPETSRKAAKRIAPKRGTLLAQMWRAFHADSLRSGDVKGYTDHEMRETLMEVLHEQIDIRSIGSARISLRDKYQFIKDSGLRRPTPSGAEAIVWVLTDLGAEEWDKQKRGE